MVLITMIRSLLFTGVQPNNRHFESKKKVYWHNADR